MTNEEAKSFLIDISYKLGNMAVEYLTEKDGEKMREAIKALEQQTCENINEDYADCDQFKCSECQIELQDWDRVERDDDGEVSYHEYTFKYCPHCGRRIKYDE